VDEALQTALHLSYQNCKSPRKKPRIQRSKYTKRTCKNDDFESYWTECQESVRRLKKIQKRRATKLKKAQDSGVEAVTAAIDCGPQKLVEFEVTLSLEQHIEYTFKEARAPSFQPEMVYRTVRPANDYFLRQRLHQRAANRAFYQPNPPFSKLYKSDINDVPMKLKNFRLLHCALKCKDLDDENTESVSFEYLLPDKDDSMARDVFLPIYSCPYPSAYTSKTFPYCYNLLQNTTIKQVVARMITEDHITEDSPYPSVNEVARKLTFSECHDPHCNLLPLSFKVSRLMMDYLPIRHILKRVLIPYLGYNKMHYLSMTVRVRVPETSADLFGGTRGKDWLAKKGRRQDLFIGTKHPVQLRSGAECTVLSVDAHDFEYESPDEDDDYSSSSSSPVAGGLFWDSSDWNSDSSSDEPFWRWR